MNKLLIGAVAVIIAIIVIVLLVFVVMTGSESIEDDWVIEDDDDDDDGETIGSILQTLRINYQDGTTSDIETQWIYNQNKKIDTITYIISGVTSSSGTVNISNYQIHVEVLYDHQVINEDTFDLSDYASVSINAEQETEISSYTFSPYDLINYNNIPDGVYNIRITPSGSITWDDKNTNLPSSFDFAVNVIDERAVEIDFGT